VRTFSRLTSRYGSFAPGSLSRTVLWPHWDLLHIHSGSVTFRGPDGKIILEQGRSILIPPDTEFTLRCGDQVCTASVQYFVPESGTETARILDRIRRPLTCRGRKENRIEPHILELMKLYSPGEPPGRRQELLLELILEKIITAAAEGKRPGQPWESLINRYRARMERPPSMEELAGWAGYSPSRFRVLFRQDTGLSPARYFHNIRMESAAETLRESVLPVKEVALMHGYANVSHFSRAFSAHYGMGPGRYRKEYALLG